MTMFHLGRFNYAVRIFICIIYQLPVERIISWCKVNTYRCQTSAAIDRTQHCATGNIHIHITTYTTCRQCHTTVATTTSEYVTIHIRSSCSTNLQAFLSCERLTTVVRITVAVEVDFYGAANVHHCIAQYMTVLTAAEDGTEDASPSADIYFRLLYIRPGVEICTLVTLTTTEEVTGYRMFLCIFVCARYANRATHHIDGTLTT